MTAYQRFTAMDLLKFNVVNLDQLTETYGNNFYGEYLTHWPEYFRSAKHPTGITMGYIMGKAEGEGEDWHGHVSAVTVAPVFRRLGLGEELMRFLEDTTEIQHNAYFVDLFVRRSNFVAIDMYNKMKYIVYRTVLKYYGSNKAKDPGEDAFDMRKAMKRDAKRSRSSVIPLKEPITPDELEWQ